MVNFVHVTATLLAYAVWPNINSGRKPAMKRPAHISLIESLTSPHQVSCNPEGHETTVGPPPSRCFPCTCES
jgi:hypothetical protein